MADNWVIPNEGKSLILDELFRLTSSRESFLLKQFQSSTTVGDASTLADFTICNYTGYSDVAIARTDFSAATISSNIGNIVKSANPVFTCTGGSAQTVYGLLLVGATSGKIYAGVNYGTPITMISGATDTINPLKVQDKTFV